MASVNVSYDFEELQSSGVGPNDYKTKGFIVTSSGGVPAANVKYNDINYFAFKVYFCKNDQNINIPNCKGFVVIECVDDVNAPDKRLFFTVPVTTGGSGADFESFLTGASSVKFTLNNNLKSGDSVKVATSSPNTTLIVGTIVQVKTEVFNSGISTTQISGLDLLSCSGLKSPNGKLTQQSIEWEMNCAIVDETESETKMVSPKMDSNQAITLFLTSLMVASGVYILAPAIYTGLGYDNLNESKTISFKGLNGNWGIVLIGAALLCIITGVTLKMQQYYFTAITLVIAYFAGSQSVKADLVNRGKSSILDEKGGPFDIFFTIKEFGFTNLRWWSLLLACIYFVLVATLGNALKSPSTFDAMLISFLMACVGATVFDENFDDENSTLRKLIPGACVALAVSMSVIYPTLATLLTK